MPDDGNASASSPTAGVASSEPPAAESPTGVLPGGHWAQAELPAEDDNDSSLGDDAVSSTASITSSILRYRTVLGRTYHSERGNAQYWGANDEQASETLDLAHHFLTLCLDDKLHLAPLAKTIQKALDIGTGTGIWAIDFADQYPDCEVIGTDLSPIQPSWVPPNLKFEIDDCTQHWTYAPGSIDFVHGRYLLGSIGDWVALAKEAYKSLKPGGFFESYEASPFIGSEDGTVTETSAMGQWGKLFVEGGKKLGQTFTVVPDGLQKKAMEEAGFVDIQEWDFNAPLGQWPMDAKLKEIGIYSQFALENDIPGFVSFVANLLGWSKEEVEVYAAHFRREMRNKALHGIIKLKVVWGKKPE
ncbi:Methyltransferase domain-containing protein [Pleurostoma richardsiae]|uniref:Methyltransferase domain-containing protein n=1 Tax=Pleurostoma richardsiae TaxID=41990 RepID=A0AA38RQ36_9PEZI|nr:Methyltransferase domain-containing protein [Pleurostoma richardsiae]